MTSDRAQIRTAEQTLTDGTVYSSSQGHRPFSIPPLEAYGRIVGGEKMERLYGLADKLRGLKLLEMNATAVGGGVAEMLYSSIPFLDSLGIDVEWRIVSGGRDYYDLGRESMAGGHGAGREAFSTGAVVPRSLLRPPGVLFVGDTEGGRVRFQSRWEARAGAVLGAGFRLLRPGAGTPSVGGDGAGLASFGCGHSGPAARQPPVAAFGFVRRFGGSFRPRLLRRAV